jgi:hypothetical protein
MMHTLSTSWLIDKLDPDVVFRVAVYKERAEAVIDGVHCDVDVTCPDSVIAYLSMQAVANASIEVKAAADQLLRNAYLCGALRHNDHAVYRRGGEIFNGVKQMHYGPKHADEARELMSRELRRCVVCRIDVYTLFEHFIKCVEVGARSYTYAIRRPDGRGAFHVIVEDPADALDGINRLLFAQYRVVAEPDLEVFETLSKIYAKPSC